MHTLLLSWCLTISVSINSIVTKNQDDSEIHIESFSNNGSSGCKLAEHSAEEAVWLHEESSSRDEDDHRKHSSSNNVSVDDNNSLNEQSNDDDDDVVVIEVEAAVTSAASDEYAVIYNIVWCTQFILHNTTNNMSCLSIFIYLRVIVYLLMCYSVICILIHLMYSPLFLMMCHVILRMHAYGSLVGHA